jgi:hypothetical protein
MEPGVTTATAKGGLCNPNGGHQLAFTARVPAMVLGGILWQRISSLSACAIVDLNRFFLKLLT